MRDSLVRALILSGFLTFSACLAETPDLAQLKTKLQQLEQMMQDLKTQIAAAEQSQNTPAPPVAQTATKESGVSPPQVPVEHIGEETRTRDMASMNNDSAPRINTTVTKSSQPVFSTQSISTIFREFRCLRSSPHPCRPQAILGE